MALTVGTQRLGLQNAEASTSKSVVLVKLTDSALGAIAQFLRQRVGRHFFKTQNILDNIFIPTNYLLSSFIINHCAIQMLAKLIFFLRF